MNLILRPVLGLVLAIWATIALAQDYPSRTVTILARDGAIPVVSPPPEELRRFVNRETERWGKVVEQAGLAGSE
jgi:hypothetical protein